MIVVDTSALIDSLGGPRRSAPRMRSLIESGEHLALPTLVLYEWWPRARSVDLAVAAHAVSRGAGLWTLNPEDFADVPEVVLV